MTAREKAQAVEDALIGIHSSHTVKAWDCGLSTWQGRCGASWSEVSCRACIKGRWERHPGLTDAAFLARARELGVVLR